MDLKITRGDAINEGTSVEPHRLGQESFWAKRAATAARQSERFKETAREVGADESSDAFDRIVKEMARTKREGDNDG